MRKQRTRRRVIPRSFGDALSGFERFERVGGEFSAEFDHRGGALQVQAAAGGLREGDEDVRREPARRQRSTPCMASWTP